MMPWLIILHMIISKACAKEEGLEAFAQITLISLLDSAPVRSLGL
jgi:hypothetical protein